MNKFIHASIIAITTTACVYPHVNTSFSDADLEGMPIEIVSFPNQTEATKFCNSKLPITALLSSFGANYGCSRYNTRTKTCEIYIAKQLIDGPIFRHELAHCVEKRNG